jgi:hypothetical protein
MSPCRAVADRPPERAHTHSSPTAELRSHRTRAPLRARARRFTLERALAVELRRRAARRALPRKRKDARSQPLFRPRAPPRARPPPGAAPARRRAGGGRQPKRSARALGAPPARGRRRWPAAAPPNLQASCVKRSTSPRCAPMRAPAAHLEVGGLGDEALEDLAGDAARDRRACAMARRRRGGGVGRGRGSGAVRLGGVAQGGAAAKGAAEARRRRRRTV